MKNKSILAICALLLVTGVTAQNSIKPNRGFAFGFHLNQYQQDFGYGVNITSPLFFRDGVAIRLRGNMMFNQNPLNGQSTWMPYGNLTLGLVGIASQVNAHLRIYGEGGVIGLFPSSDFSSESFVFGGYGLFGFEFSFVRFGNYFVEVGAAGTGARADKIPTSPIYSNGLTVSAGLRFVLPGQDDFRKSRIND